MADATLFTAATTGAVSNLEGAFFALHDGTGSGDQVSNERLQPNYGSASNGEADLAEPLEFTTLDRRPRLMAAMTALVVW